MSTFFLAEARRITGHCIRKLLLRKDCVNKFTNHGMFAGTDQIQVLSLDFIHHGIHLGKPHNTGYHIAADHKRRHTISEAAADHKISCIRNNCRMKPCNISHKIIESIAGYFAGTVQINAIKALHNLCMIRNLKIRNHRIPIFLNLHILTVIFSNGNTRINDIRNRHHNLCYFFIQLFFLCGQLLQAGSICSHFLFYFFCFIFLALPHQCTNLLGKLIPLRPKLICLLLCCSSVRIQSDHLIHQRKLFFLKFILYILLYNISIFSDKF